MSETTDAMDKELRDALARDWNPNSDDDTAETVATLVSQFSIWRSRAAHWRGKSEGQAETIAYLKERIKTLEEASTA